MKGRLLDRNLLTQRERFGSMKFTAYIKKLIDDNEGLI